MLEAIQRPFAAVYFNTLVRRKKTFADKLKSRVVRPTFVSKIFRSIS